jgi:hypothetical protein
MNDSQISYLIQDLTEESRPGDASDTKSRTELFAFVRESFPADSAAAKADAPNPFMRKRPSDT